MRLRFCAVAGREPDEQALQTLENHESNTEFCDALELFCLGHGFGVIGE
jgi:hypothetical protein